MYKNAFENIYTEYENLLNTFYLREEAESLIDKLSTLKGRSSYIYRKHELIRKLEMAGIDADDKMSENELSVCAKKLPKEKDVEKRMFEMLYRIYKSFETPEQHIEKIVRRLGDERYRGCSVRLAILKQFILNTDYHTGPVKEMIRGRIHAETGKLVRRTDNDPRLLADWADETLFNVIKNQLTKNEKKKYHLLKICDDLAAGRFKTNGNTRKSLYMFAFAFDMSSYADPDFDNFDPETDIETQLFFEFYGNHMMRFLKSGNVDKKSDYEAEPSGEGINYKNFEEVIYLYYLNKKNLSIRKRLACAEKMIEECEAAYVCKHPDENTFGHIEQTRDFYTYIYRDYYLGIIQKMKEEDVKNFILRHYICMEKDRSRSGIMISSETVTACYRYRMLIRKKGQEPGHREKDIDRYMEINTEWDEAFRNLIYHLSEMLHTVRVTNPTHITRTGMIAAFYEVCRTKTDQEGMSLPDLFEDCASKLNPILVESRFQPLNTGNIFDVFMVMMLYRYLNII